MSKPLSVLLQYCIPQHGLSRLVGCLTNCRIPWIKNLIIRWFVRHYKVNMTIAAQDDIKCYSTFNDFFTRQLKDGARSIDVGANTIISPVDGVMSQFGKIEEDQLFQAKGLQYSLNCLLAENPIAEKFRDGDYVTLYLSPKDYHRIHMPLDGTLIEMTVVPGKLFSVNAVTTEHVEQLFTRNERVVCIFQTKMGRIAVIMVGAMLVAGIHTKWAGRVFPGRKNEIQTCRYDAQNIAYAKGQDIGYFELGSTVIVLFEPHSVMLKPSLQTNKPINMGQVIGEIIL